MTLSGAVSPAVTVLSSVAVTPAMRRWSRGDAVAGDDLRLADLRFCKAIHFSRLGLFANPARISMRIHRITGKDTGGQLQGLSGP